MKTAIIILLVLMLPTFGQVTVNWINPTNNQTVSGTIPLQVQASSTSGQIVKVEFYRDGVLINTVYRPSFPTNLKIMRLLFHWNSRTNSWIKVYDI